MLADGKGKFVAPLLKDRKLVDSGCDEDSGCNETDLTDGDFKRFQFKELGEELRDWMEIFIFRRSILTRNEKKGGRSATIRNAGS